MKMFLESVILIALTSVVRTAVIINVYEDGENKVSHSLRGGCNYRACDQLCRRLGFTGGACVGDRCKCDNFAPLKENKDHPVRSGCNLTFCDQQCRRLGYTGGTCIGDVCKCDNFEPIKLRGKTLTYLLRSAEEAQASHSLADCNFQACDQLCRNLGFPGGACVGDRCECDNFREDIVKEDKSEPRSCDAVTCDEMCHRLNYAGCDCREGSCECY